MLCLTKHFLHIDRIFITYFGSKLPYAWSKFDRLGSRSYGSVLHLPNADDQEIFGGRTVLGTGVIARFGVRDSVYHA